MSVIAAAVAQEAADVAALTAADVQLRADLTSETSARVSQVITTLQAQDID